MLQTNQFYNYEISVAPTVLPLTLEEVEAHLRLPADSEDTYLTFLINAVSDFFERYTNRTLINTTYKGYLDDFPYYLCDQCNYDGNILIRKSKVSSITSIKYLSDSVLITWDSSNYYFTASNIYSSVALTEDAVYPDPDVRLQSIEIIFVAGFGAASTDIPNDIKIAMLDHIAFLYENRGDCGSDGTCKLPCTTKTIYDKYKIVSLGWGFC